MRTERHVLQEPDPPRYPGDWIPYGRVPIELIQPPDYGPVIALAGPQSLRGYQDVSGQNFRHWHALRRAGLR